MNDIQPALHPSPASSDLLWFAKNHYGPFKTTNVCEKLKPLITKHLLLDVSPRSDVSGCPTNVTYRRAVTNLLTTAALSVQRTDLEKVKLLEKLTSVAAVEGFIPFVQEALSVLTRSMVFDSGEEDRVTLIQLFDADPAMAEAIKAIG